MTAGRKDSKKIEKTMNLDQAYYISLNIKEVYKIDILAKEIKKWADEFEDKDEENKQ